MSNATEERQEAEKELKEMEQQLTQAAEAEKEKAVPEEPAPSPEPDASPAPEANPEPETPVTPEAQSQVQQTPKDDPMEWAKKKGFKSPEDMARALLQKEQEFHQSRQKQNGQQQGASDPIPPQNWNPGPQMNPGYGFQPQPSFYQPQPPRMNPRDLAPYYPQLNPEDVERLMPLVLDAADIVSNRKVAALEQRFGMQIGTIQRQTERNNELMSLMQDPAFSDSRVQKEIHSILDSDPAIFQRERMPLSHAYEKAMVNLARKQLQQGVIPENGSTMTNTPPVTAGGGNGSAFTTPRPITERDFDSWSLKDQERYLNSGGKILPKK